jgi:hypothetical protein
MSGTTTVPVSERRHWQRLALAIPVFVRGVDDAGRPFLEFATALNISAGGALLVLRRSLSPHTEVGVEIPAAPIADKVMARRTLDGEILRVQNSFGWSSCATRFVQPLLQEGESDLKE